MPAVVLIGLVLLVTSVMAGALGVRWLGFSGPCLRKAVLETLETVGVGVIFFGANLTTGMVTIAAMHLVTGRFVSHYVLSDITVLSFSLLQGSLWVWWHRASERAGHA